MESAFASPAVFLTLNLKNKWVVSLTQYWILDILFYRRQAMKITIYDASL